MVLTSPRTPACLNDVRCAISLGVAEAATSRGGRSEVDSCTRSSSLVAEQTSCTRANFLYIGCTCSALVDSACTVKLRSYRRSASIAKQRAVALFKADAARDDIWRPCTLSSSVSKIARAASKAPLRQSWRADSAIDRIGRPVGPDLFGLPAQQSNTRAPYWVSILLELIC